MKSTDNNEQIVKSMMGNIFISIFTV